MNFEISQFQGMLDQYQLMCSSFVAQTQNGVEKMLKNYTQTIRIFADQECTLKSQLKMQQELNQTRQQAKSQYESGAAEMGQKMDLLKAQVEQMQSEVNNIKQQIAQTRQSIESHKKTIQETSKAQVNNALKQKHDMYQNMLRMRLELGEEDLKVVFWGVSAADEKKQFSATFANTAGDIKLKEISHQLVGVDQFVEECQLTGNFGLLLRRIRRGFVQQYGQQQ